MYGLFYAGHLALGGIGYLLGAVGVVDAVRRREEQHETQLWNANVAGFWSGYGQAWPVAYRSGEEHMLGVCQALAAESIDMIGADPETQEAFNQLVYSWPEYALAQQQATLSGLGFPA